MNSVRKLWFNFEPHNTEMCCKKYLSNCWKSLKLFKLQRKNEINLDVNVMKIEKIK